MMFKVLKQISPIDIMKILQNQIETRVWRNA